MIYISRKKYDVRYADTIEFLDRAVVPYVEVLPIGLDEYLKAKEIMQKYDLKPSDAFHVATIYVHRLDGIARRMRISTR
ncbi:MAG: PIN domain-containing protein [Thermoprotei archaeon]